MPDAIEGFPQVAENYEKLILVFKVGLLFYQQSQVKHLFNQFAPLPISVLGGVRAI